MAVHHWLVIIERLLEYLKIKSSESLLFKSELMLKNLHIYIYIYIYIYACTRTKYFIVNKITRRFVAMELCDVKLKKGLCFTNITISM